MQDVGFSGLKISYSLICVRSCTNRASHVLFFQSMHSGWEIRSKPPAWLGKKRDGTWKSLGPAPPQGRQSLVLCSASPQCSRVPGFPVAFNETSLHDKTLTLLYSMSSFKPWKSLNLRCPVWRDSFHVLQEMLLVFRMEWTFVVYDCPR